MDDILGLAHGGALPHMAGGGAGAGMYVRWGVADAGGGFGYGDLWAIQAEFASVECDLARGPTIFVDASFTPISDETAPLVGVQDFHFSGALEASSIATRVHEGERGDILAPGVSYADPFAIPDEGVSVQSDRTASSWFSQTGDPPALAELTDHGGFMIGGRDDFFFLPHRAHWFRR